MENDVSKNTNDSRALKGGIGFVISEIVIRGISFISTPIFTRLLSQAVYGDVKTFDAWLYLLMPLLSLSLAQSIGRAKFDFKEKYDSYVSSITFLILLLGTSAWLICLPFRSYVAAFLDCPPEVLWIIFAYVVADAAILCYQRKERQLFHYRSSILLSFLMILLSVGTSVAFVLLNQSKISDEDMLIGRITSFYVPIIIIGIFVICFAFIRGKSFINLTYWKYALRFSIPLIFYSVSMQVLNQSDKIMVRRFCGADLAGIYAVAATVVYIMDVINNAITDGWTPWIYDKLNTNGIEHVQKVWMTILAGMGVLTWLLVMAGPELILFLGGKSYSSAIWLLGPMVSGSFAHFVTIGCSNIEKFYKRTSCTAYASILSMILNLILNYYFISRFGYIAAAYTTAVSYLVAVLVHMGFMKKNLPNSVIPMGKTVLLLLGMLIINTLSMILYNTVFWIRWACIIIIAIILLIVFRTTIKNILNLLFGDSNGMD